MAGNTEILREYLIALGFKVDTQSTNKADEHVHKIDKRVKALAKGTLAVGVAAQALVVQFARSMESLYYSSRKAESTAGNLQAIAYGGKQVGVDMKGMVENVARALRLNPGLTGLLNSLGVKVEGRDRSDVLMDMVGALKGMPHYVAAQYASLFGIDPDSLLLMEEGYDKMKAAAALRKQMAADAGLDMTAAAEAGLEYANMLDQITESGKILKDVVALALLPVFRTFGGVILEVMKDWSRLIPTLKGPGDFMAKLWEGTKLALGFKTDYGIKLSASSAARVAAGEAGPAKVWGGAAKPAAVGPTNTAALFARLEAANGLPAGLLDKMWAKESGRGKYMLSPAGAQGHFGFMPGTAKEMGLADPNDLESSAGAAAGYMARMMKMNGGDLQKALASYNWGPGNVKNKGMAKLPWETQDYVQSISGQPITIQQQTTIQITAPDALAAGQQVAAAQDRVNADLARNVGTSKVQ